MDVFWEKIGNQKQGGVWVCRRKWPHCFVAFKFGDGDPLCRSVGCVAVVAREELPLYPEITSTAHIIHSMGLYLNGYLTAKQLRLS